MAALANYRDEVKHMLNDTTGVVIAKYVEGGKTYLDVRSTDDHIHERTPAENWTVTLAAAPEDRL